MEQHYRQYFALTKEPFSANLSRKEILETHAIKAISERLHYTIRLGALMVVTGEIGSGKSTALRYCSSGLHPSEYHVLHIRASSGSILELYRNILAEFGVENTGISRIKMIRRIQHEITQLAVGKKITPVLIIDEASLLRLDVFSELHTLTQFEQDSKPYLPLILAGQGNLVDNLHYRGSQPLASRVVARAHLKAIESSAMEEYLAHHLKIAGKERTLFNQDAMTAIHQGSGGLYRKANHLARGALIAASKQNSQTISAEHVRLASTELF